MTNATILTTYESTTLSELTQWVTEQRKASADKLLLRRRAEDTNGHELVRSWPMEGEINAAQMGGSLEVSNFRLKRAESAQRRFASAVRSLTLVRALLPRGGRSLNTDERSVAVANA